MFAVSLDSWKGPTEPLLAKITQIAMESGIHVAMPDVAWIRHRGNPPAYRFVSRGDPQVIPQVTPQVALLLHNLGDEDLDRATLQERLGLSDRKSFRALYLAPALSAGFVVFTLPDKPNSRLQKYRLTEAGRLARAELRSLAH